MTELDGLHIGAELGRGAFGTVHRVRWRGLTYALKRPHADEPGILAAFQREAALLACIDDPGVPRVHAVGTFDGLPALVLEYIPGKSLADLITPGPLAPERVAGIAADLARALAAAHRVGLVHRDVKPTNIMLWDGQVAKLIDFGLALVGPEAVEDRTVGTFRYTAPEQTGMLRRPVDGRSDLYSLGVVMFQSLTGRLPFESEDTGALLQMHMSAPVPDLTELCPGIDPALAAVVTRLLAKDPDDRYPDAAALMTALRACPGGESAAADAVTRWPLHGRDAERDDLADRWRRARAGEGGIAVIRGAAGSGRSRLAEEVVATAGTDVPVLRAACEQDQPLPFGALRAALDDHLAAVSRLPEKDRIRWEQHLRDAAATAGPSLVARLSARLDELVGADEPAGAEVPDDHVFAAAAAFLTDLSHRHGGLLLVFDDAHWLDTGSREVLDRLALDLAGQPTLLLLTERAGHPAEDADGGGRPGLVADLEIALRPLSADDVATIIASRLPGAAVTPILAVHVIARTDRTPLAVIAYLLRLLDSGLLTPERGTWRFDAAGADELPAAAGVRELLGARLATLAPDERDVLLTAAIAGARFRTETLGGEPDRVLAAVAAAVERRVVEARPGGWFAFVHPLLRESLLDDVDDERRYDLHAAVAAALEALPEHLRDADHVYAVARHHRRAGDRIPVGTRRRSSLAAGLAALDDRAPAEAIGYLEDLDEPAALHPLALAYLRAARFADADRTLGDALGRQTDPRERARLLIMRIELHHTLWDDESALAATADALAELRHPLPRNAVARVVSTLAIGIAGGAVRRTGWGFASARGRRRDDAAMLAEALTSGGYAAALGLRLKEAGVLSVRALYAVNRLGPSPEYVRAYAQVGYVAAVMKLRGPGERCFERAAATARRLGDPALVAYVEWLRGCAMLFGGHDDGSRWEQTITRHARYYGPAQLIPGSATIGLRLLLRGYSAESQAEYERGLRRLNDDKLIQGTSFAMLSVMIPAMQGRPGDAAAALTGLTAAAGTTVQRANMLVAAACAAVEQGEFGEGFDRIIDEFRDLGLVDRKMMTQHKWFYAFQSHGRMAQLRMATDEQRPGRTAAARAAVADLRRVRKGSPLLDAAYLIGESALALLLGDPRRAIEWSDKAELVARRIDAPLVHFEVARFRARSFKTLGMANEADRHARVAVSLATMYGWESRRRQTRTEFDVDERAGTPTDRRTVAASPGGNRRLEALQQVGAAAATVLEPRQLVRVALDEMLRMMGAERALFFLLDDAGEPFLYAARGAAATGYGNTLVRRAASTGEALVLTGTEQGAALGSRSVEAHGLRSVMVVPVQFKGNTLGVMYLDSRVARGIFTDDDVEVLTGVTSYVAASLETARAAQLHLAVRSAQQQQAFAEMLRECLAELSAIHEPAEVLRALFGMLRKNLKAREGLLLAPDGETVLEAFGADKSDFFDKADLVVPFDNGDGTVGTALFGGDFDDSAQQVAAALTTQGMSAYLNACLFSRVQELATTDELTGQHNRRHFHAIAGALVEAAARGNRDLAAVMLDIDRFKSINDSHGHAAGDDVIRAVAERIRSAVRQSDVLGRYGGEEFAVVLPDHEGEAADLAERMRSAVGDTPIPTRAGPLRVTISVGLAHFDPADGTLDQLLARADHALYRAKETGRDRVVTA